MLRLLKPTGLALMLMLLMLVAQAAFLSSSRGGYEEYVDSFGLGSPIQLFAGDHQTRVSINWGVLTANLGSCYLLAALLGRGMTVATGLKRPSVAYGRIAVAAVVITFLISIVMSKRYWGYFMQRPGLLLELKQIAQVDAIIPIKTQKLADGKRAFVVETNYSLAEQIADGKRDTYYCLAERVLIELERRKLLPASPAETLEGLAQLYATVLNSGALAKSDPGYDSAADLQGIVVDALDGASNRMVVVAIRGGRVANDHLPYYELLFRGRKDNADLSFIRGQHFFYDSAGIEGMEWYIGWLLMAPCGVAIGFVVFTIERVCRVGVLHGLRRPVH
jgi:hypothetical protein